MFSSFSQAKISFEQTKEYLKPNETQTTSSTDLSFRSNEINQGAISAPPTTLEVCILEKLPQKNDLS